MNTTTQCDSKEYLFNPIMVEDDSHWGPSYRCASSHAKRVEIFKSALNNYQYLISDRRRKHAPVLRVIFPTDYNNTPEGEHTIDYDTCLSNADHFSLH